MQLLHVAYDINIKKQFFHNYIFKDDSNDVSAMTMSENLSPGCHHGDMPA